METLTCRLLPYEAANGPRNMAADEVLLESAAAGVASLRFYGWSEPTLSLGYFQPERVRQADPRVAALPCVRRPSGGAALVHHHELTYALAVPAGSPWQASSSHLTSWLRRVHKAIAAALGSLGVAARLWCARSEQNADGLLCFQKLTPGDLVLGTTKVVGSAQRRQRGALMQHGGILLAASPHAPVLPGILELTGLALSVQEVSQAVLGELSRRFSWRMAATSWMEREGRRIDDLVETRYASPTWNQRR